MQSPVTQTVNDYTALEHAIMDDIQSIADLDEFLASNDAEDEFLTLLHSKHDAEFGSDILQ